MNSSLIAQLRTKLANDTAARNGFVSRTNPDDFTAAVATQVQAMDEGINALTERIGQLEAEEARRDQFAASAPRISVTERHNPIYNPSTGNSFFRDIARVGLGDVAARDRLAASQERALSTGAGAGGQFAPPAWLVEDFIALARPGRVTADLVVHQDLPGGVSSINLPKIATGAAEAVQASQNTALQSTDLTTTSVSSGITLIGGTQTISRQLLDQSGVPFDRVILEDLAADYAKQLDLQVLSGSGASGQLQGIIGLAGINAQTYTNASPAFGGAGQFNSQVLQAKLAIETTRFKSPTAIVMHPRRWAWVLNAVDSQNRPLVTPDGAAFNQPAMITEITAQGSAGTLAGLPVFLDPNVPTNLGAGTNQDVVLVLRAEDLFLWESVVEQASFEATYANQASVLFRVMGYAAFIPGRYPTAIAAINGTGLVTPSM